MTPEQLTRAKEQAKLLLTFIPEPEPEPRSKPWRSTGERPLPACVYRMEYRSGVFYKAQFKIKGKLQYVGTYPTVELAQLWLDRAKRNPRMPKGVVLL